MDLECIMLNEISQSEKDKYHMISLICGIFFKKRFYILIFRERERGAESEGEKHQSVVASHTLSTGDLAPNPGMCPDWESNRDPLVHRSALNPLRHTSLGVSLICGV